LSRPVHVGCSGWQYREWRGVLYPEGVPQRRWLERYAEVFDTVELNTTFYRLPRPMAAQEWVRRTPPGFTFAAKASRYLIHVKRLADLDQGIARFYESLAPLVASPKLGPIVWQLPANFHRDDARLAAALEALPPGRHCWEFRHASWFTEEVYALLRRHGAALVIGDHPARPFQEHVLTTDWTLIRFHHGTRGRRGNYSDSELGEWGRRITAWSRETEVFAYFNNDWEGFAVRNAKRLRTDLERRQESPRP
jgi:uncharacterized protein YecE (DUF72 family)